MKGLGINQTISGFLKQAKSSTIKTSRALKQNVKYTLGSVSENKTKKLQERKGKIYHNDYLANPDAVQGKILSNVTERTHLEHHKYDTKTLDALKKHFSSSGNENELAVLLINSALAQKKTFQKEIIQINNLNSSDNLKSLNNTTQEKYKTLKERYKDFNLDNIPNKSSDLIKHLDTQTKIINPGKSTSAKTPALALRKERMKDEKSLYMTERKKIHNLGVYTNTIDEGDEIKNLVALNDIQWSNDNATKTARQQYADNVYNIRSVPKDSDLDQVLQMFHAKDKKAFGTAKDSLITKLTVSAKADFDTLTNLNSTENIVFDESQKDTRQLFASKPVDTDNIIDNLARIVLSSDTEENFKTAHNDLTNAKAEAKAKEAGATTIQKMARGMNLRTSNIIDKKKLEQFSDKTVDNMSIADLKTVLGIKERQAAKTKKKVTFIGV